MPAGFPYRALFLKGRPKHEKYDDFWRKHPPMDTGRRAKIFAPFDALAGFDECIQSKLVQYGEKKTLSEGEMEKLDTALAVLHSLTYNSKAARMNKPQAEVIYFVPCTDLHSEWYGIGGQYQTISGTVKKVDAIIEKAIFIDDKRISLDDVVEISLKGGILKPDSLSAGTYSYDF